MTAAPTPPSVLAEIMPIGTFLEWPTAPRVCAPIGTLPFAAPSASGQVVGVVTGPDGRKHTGVRFRYRNPGGGQSWSEPIGVLPGQACKVVTPSRI